MKSEYEFDFTTTGFRFEKDHSYTATLSHCPPLSNGLIAPKDLKIGYRIVRDNETIETDPKNSQSGKLYVTIPFRHKGMEDFVYGLVHSFQRQIHFNSPGKFDVYLACYLGHEIPENEEEALELGDKPHFAMLRLVEAIGDPTFDSGAFVKNSGKLDGTYLDFFNHAFRANNPIDKYMSYFKILEDFVSQNEKSKFKRSLIENGVVREIFTETSNRLEVPYHFEEFIDRIVQTRHECAHFKRSSNFGFHAGDIRLKKVVDEYIPMLEAITYKLILKNGG